MENPFDFDQEKKHPFNVPENYFQKLPLKINERLLRKKSTFGFFSGGVKWAFAGVIALLMISFFIFRNNGTDSSGMSEYLAEVSDDTIVDYLENESISTEEIIAMSDLSDIYNENLLPETIEPEEVEFYELEDALILEYEQQNANNL